ncbi:MAG: glycosyltransferase family 39 protein [Nitrospirae bacterium]|nr:glycosyltransferase family 39 protein [Nitrospirota bacterium]
MTYHLPKVMHWIANHNVSHYPTNITFQLFNSPGAEFAAAHFLILSNTGSAANLVQWLSMAGSVIGVSLVAELLGASRRGQIFASVLTASIPMGILQSTSTQNDYVAAFWLVCFVYFTLLLKDAPKKTVALASGVSLGLAVLVKPTSYFFAFPYLLWCVLKLIKTIRTRAWIPASIIVLLTLSLNIGHYTRNISLYGHPNASKRFIDIQTIKGLPLPLIFSNVVKNMALNMSTPSDAINKTIVKAFNQIHKLLHIDIDDIRSTSHSFPFAIPFTLNEDNTGNLIHFILILLCAVVLIMRHNEPEDLTRYAVSIAAGFILMCCFLKWQPWSSRYHLPLFVLSTPFIAVILNSAKNQKVISAAIVLVLLSALPWVLLNERRPIIGKDSIFVTDRMSQLFISRPELKRPYTGAAAIIQSKGCTNIGLSLPDDDAWEHPFWVLLNRHETKVRTEHVNVKNESAVYSETYPFNNFVPCAVISLRPEEGTGFILNNSRYEKEWEAGPVMVLTLRPTASIQGSGNTNSGSR